VAKAKKEKERGKAAPSDESKKGGCGAALFRSLAGFR
jgi:hypothetical protein